MILRKLANGYIWRRILYERLTEPLHLNLLAAFVALFGGFRRKVEYDLVVRHNHAYGLLRAADVARGLGLAQVCAIEFGVAAGAGLLNMCEIARRVTRETGVRFRIIGFDLGTGMPAPGSYRDHPELYQEGDFPMDAARLKQALPDFAELEIGEVAERVAAFLPSLSPQCPLGFVSVDVDYYSSTKSALEVLRGPAGCYLPRVQIYLDDLEDESHNSYCGELLAVSEFNAATPLRKIEPHRFLRSYRLFKNARWIDHMMICHVLDHPSRNTIARDRAAIALSNPYLKA